MAVKSGRLAILILALAISFIIVQSAAAQQPDEENFGDLYCNLLEESNSSVTVFYSSACSVCKTTLPKIEELSQRYPDITVSYFNIYDSSENRTLMLGFGDKYDMSYPGIPVVFTGNMTAIEGASDINKNIEEIFKALDSGKMPDEKFEYALEVNMERLGIETPDPADAAPAEKEEISVLLVVLAGLADGINPCAISVMILLLAALSTRTSRTQVLLSGLLYTVAVFTLYILAGLGLLSIIQVTGLEWWFSVFAGIVAIVAGLIVFADVFRNKDTVTLGIPESRKEGIKTVIDKASLPAAFVLGIMVGLFELPCTGGIYIAILGLLSSEMTFYEGLPYLVLYNLMFIVPLVIIIFAVAFGLSPETVDKWRDSNKRLLRIFIGTILLAMGIYLILRLMM